MPPRLNAATRKRVQPLQQEGRTCCSGSEGLKVPGRVSPHPSAVRRVPGGTGSRGFSVGVAAWMGGWRVVNCLQASQPASCKKNAILAIAIGSKLRSTLAAALRTQRRPPTHGCVAGSCRSSRIKGGRCTCGLVLGRSRSMMAAGATEVVWLLRAAEGGLLLAECRWWLNAGSLLCAPVAGAAAAPAAAVAAAACSRNQSGHCHSPTSLKNLRSGSLSAYLQGLSSRQDHVWGEPTAAGHRRRCAC